MPDLAQNLFLRELAKRDLDRQRAQQEQAAQAEAVSTANRDSEAAKDAAFKRQLEVAKLQGENAARMGEEEPGGYENGAVGEMAGVGYGSGRAKVKAAEDEYNHKQALEQFKELQNEKRDKAKSQLDTERESTLAGLNGANAMEKEKYNRSSVEKVADLDRAERAREANMREAGANQRQGGITKGLTKEHTDALAEGEELSRQLDNIENLAKDSQTGQSNFKQYQNYYAQGLNTVESAQQKAGWTIDPIERERLMRYAEWLAHVKALGAVQVRNLHGKATTQIELQTSAGSILNSNMSETQFLGVIRAQRRNIANKMDISRQILNGTFDPKRELVPDTPVETKEATEERSKKQMEYMMLLDKSKSGGLSSDEYDRLKQLDAELHPDATGLTNKQKLGGGAALVGEKVGETAWDLGKRLLPWFIGGRAAGAARAAGAVKNTTNNYFGMGPDEPEPGPQTQDDWNEAVRKRYLP